MENKLKRQFYIGFLLLIMVDIIVISICLSMTIITLLKYFNEKLELIWSIIASILLILFLIICTFGTLPHFRDLPSVRQGKFKTTTGFIKRYRKIEHGGEPPTTNYHPIVKDNNTGELNELVVNGIELGKQYTFLYLKYTKIAVIVKEDDVIMNRTS